MEMMPKYTLVVEYLRAPTNRLLHRPGNIGYMLAFNVLSQIATAQPVLQSFLRQLLEIPQAERAVGRANYRMAVSDNLAVLT
jgi:hypothetical protein